MDWRTLNFDWNRARAFLVSAEEGSYTAAAKALNSTQTTLGRQVALLERELGVSLFEKVGRNIEITPAGIELMDHVKAMGEAATRLNLAATGNSQSLEGSVSISATEATAAFVLPELLKKFKTLEPGIKIEIVATNDTSDLRRREADIAIRNGQPTDPELIARKLPSTHAYLYASPEYLSQFEHPVKKQHLTNADFIGFEDNQAYIKALQELGLNISSDNFRCISNKHFVHWEFVKAGLGIGVMGSAVGDANKSVVRVSEDIPPFPVESWLVVHKELRTSRRIKRTYDFLFSELYDLLEAAN